MTAWTRQQAAAAATTPDARLPVIGADDVAPIDPQRDLWDMWQIMRADGSTAIVDGRQWWFFLAVPRAADPEARHDVARIRLYSRGGDGWRDHGAAFADGFSPGSREWSGSAVLADDDATLTMHFTASGWRDGGPRFAQRLFETIGRFDHGRLSEWSEPVETARGDGIFYRIADEDAPTDDRIKGFRDPGYFRDPATGREHILFTGSAPNVADVHDGVIGLATREGDGWAMRPPVVTAIGVNSELERPHIVVRNGLYYLFWSTQAKRFAPGVDAPTGLYGMVAAAIEGPWRPINGSGLVAGNPVTEPFQAYCWWVTGEGEVISFVDYWGLAGGSPAQGVDYRREQFGGTAAPIFRLAFAGDVVRLVAGDGLEG
ncbi:levansucrase [Sphingomonas jinjuensis]|uniref:Levansucrase n=1 Tax=Sphingomonas jinjuensis TaxID=535907 RepID=A0A840FBI6_9SPHN|nr:glycoside hydrolase family 68 protein [Sphingomonas jinjuensis]MBB4153606.1 levansucrase [Sphingomonas jinjuensis]